MAQMECVTQVELHISRRGLMDKDGKWLEYARTERVKNNLNPDFSKSIALDYYFEMVQKLKFTVYDVDNESTDLSDDDFLGGMECTLGQVVSKKTFTKELEIRGKPAGSITVFAEEVTATNNSFVKLEFSARDLDNKDFLGKSDPFLEISRLRSDGGYLMVHRTEVIQNNLNPDWKPFAMTVNSLCGGDYDAKLKKSFELISTLKQKKKNNYVNSGQLVVNNCEMIRVYSFLEYVMGGCQINFSVGVDFTLSNRRPNDPASLHYMDPQKPNEYIQALMAVGEICQDYDTLNMAQMECVTKVELHISCRGLKDKDVLSKSDPIAVLLMQDKDGKWLEHARTEHVKNNLNPDFSKSIALDYYFEMVQKLKFAVYDVDNESTDLSDDDFLGGMECTLGQVVSNRTFTKELEINGKKAGSISVFAEEVSTTHDLIKLEFSAHNLDNKDFMSKSDPFLEIFRMKSDGGFLLVHRTEVIKNNLNPNWKPFELTVNSLCGGDYDAKLKIDAYDYDEGDTNDFIGSLETTLNGLLDAHSKKKSFEVINPKKEKKKKNYANSGQLSVSFCEIVHVYPFLEYVMGGCQINFSIGVDFTLSNGDPAMKDSLHYMDPQKPNEYIQALMAVGEICQDYDTDKLFPAFGFGAQIPPTFQTSHIFPLNFNEANPQCEGIMGVVAAYQACLSQIELSAPTNAAPIINQVADLASEAAQQPTASQYFVLLMLTDGVLSDMTETKLALIRASYLPMSVIIVGVGSANFAKMKELDADEGLLRVPGLQVADRDIVQFVPFEDFKTQSPALLAQHVLAEVPKQVQDYFNKRKIPPLNPKGPSAPSLAGL